MTDQNISTEALELVYDKLAVVTDETAQSERLLFLTKLVLLMSNHIGDGDAVMDLIDTAKQ